MIKKSSVIPYEDMKRIEERESYLSNFKKVEERNHDK